MHLRRRPRLKEPGQIAIGHYDPLQETVKVNSHKNKRTAPTAVLQTNWLSTCLSPDRFLLPDPFADLEDHFASALVGIDDDVITVQDLPIQYLEGERILHQLLDRTLQRTGAKVRVKPLGKQQVLGCIGEFERNLALSQLPPQIFEEVVPVNL